MLQQMMLELGSGGRGGGGLGGEGEGTGVVWCHTPSVWVRKVR